MSLATNTAEAARMVGKLKLTLGGIKRQRKPVHVKYELLQSYFGLAGIQVDLKKDGIDLNPTL